MFIREFFNYSYIKKILTELGRLQHLDQLLLAIGVFAFILGIFIAAFSRIYRKERAFKSEKRSGQVVLAKGYPTTVAGGYTPFPALLRIRFKRRSGPKTIFRLIGDVQIDHSGIGRFTEQYKIFQGEKICKSGDFHFVLDPNAKYRLEVESTVESVNEKGLTQISDIIRKYLEVEGGGARGCIIIRKTKNSQVSIPVSRFIAMFQSVLYTKLRGDKLKDALIDYAKNVYGTAWAKRLRDWSNTCPSLFDAIAEVVMSHSSGEATVIGDIEYSFVRIERPYEWLFSVGLTLITSGVVVLIAGLK